MELRRSRQSVSGDFTATGEGTFDGIVVTNGNSALVGNSAKVTGIDNELQVIGTGTADSRSTLARFSADGLGPALQTLKSRQASINGSSTAVQNGDILCDFLFNGDDGTDFTRSGARIRVIVDGSVSNDTVPSRYVFQTANSGGALTDAVTIDSAQAVRFHKATGVGDGSQTNLTAAAQGTGGGPASMSADDWIPVVKDDGTSGWIPFFV